MLNTNKMWGAPSWKTKAKMPTTRAYFQMVTLKGVAYAIGGYIGHCLNSVDRYDISTDKWSAGPTFPQTVSKFILKLGDV